MILRTLTLAVLATLAHAETLDAVLARLDAAAKTSNSFSANVKWETYTKAIDDTDQKSGTIKLKRIKTGVVGRMDIDNPAAASSVYHFTGSGMNQYRPKAKMLDVYQSATISKSINQYLLLVFGSTGADLRKTFDLKAGPEETAGGVKATRLDLVPKDKKGREIADLIYMCIPAGRTYAVQVKAVAPSGDFNQWTYLDGKLNPSLPDSAFEFTVPEGTTRHPMK